MNAYPTNEKLHHWLGSLPKSIPFRAVHSGTASADGKHLPGLIEECGLPSDSLVTALVWLRVGIIEPAHEIVQNKATPLASYLHGVVHRLERDYWNAKYWFRQIHDMPLLQSISIAMVERLEEEGLLGLAKDRHFVHAGAFSPVGFVTAHEQLNDQAKTASEQAAALERIAWLEWESLWKRIELE